MKDFRDIEPDSSAAKERDRELDALAGQTEETQESIARLLDTLERVTSESVEQRLEELEAKLAELKAPEFTMLGAVRLAAGKPSFLIHRATDHRDFPNRAAICSNPTIALPS